MPLFQKFEQNICELNSLVDSCCRKPRNAGGSIGISKTKTSRIKKECSFQSFLKIYVKI